MSTEILTLVPSDASLMPVYTDREIQVETGAFQIEGKVGNRWALTLTYDAIFEDNNADLLGVFAKLHGKRNRLEISTSLLGRSRRGAGGGTPLVNGAQSAGAVSVPIDGFPNSTLVLRRGDFVQIENELKMVSEDVNSNGSGEADVGIFPELHKNISDGTACDIDTPSGVFIMMNAPSMPFRNYGGNFVEQMVFELQEDVLA